jgi:hypothetical protein
MKIRVSGFDEDGKLKWASTHDTDDGAFVADHIRIEADENAWPCTDCHENDLERIDHQANSKDWDHGYTRQGYQVYRCKRCGDYWGCRHQYDAGTGHDDRWHRFGPNFDDVKRHY